MKYVLIILFFILACSSAASYKGDYISKLKGVGPVILSDRDPNQPANLLVGFQAEKSEIVAAFIRYNGAPPVIELHSKWSGEPEVHYFYPDRREYYVVSKVRGNWLLVGPQRLTAEKLRVIQKLELSQNKPVLHLDHIKQDTVDINYSENEQFNPEIKQNYNHIQVAVDKIVNLLATRSQLEAVQQNERGDVVHSVKTKSETIGLISIWYTHDQDNQATIARINQINVRQGLSENQKIIIPAYLVRNRNAMNVAALRLLANAGLEA